MSTTSLRPIALLALFLHSLACPIVYAQNIDPWAHENRKEFRSEMGRCNTYLSPADSGENHDTPSDGVGVPLVASNDPSEVKASLLNVIESRGRDYLKGSEIWVGGVEMQNESDVLRDFQNMLLDADLKDLEIKVHVYSIPRKLFEGNLRAGLRVLADSMAPLYFNGDLQATLKALNQNIGPVLRGAPQVIGQRLRYFAPNKKNHYQKPIVEEITSGIASTAVVEASNVVYLFKSLPTLDASLTVGTHILVLGLYTVYSKTLTNWLFAPNTSRQEIFFKQILTSLPFVANFNIFGKFSQILNFYHDHGMAATAAAFPTELTHFVATQGLTLVLQTLFYQIVINNSIRGWQLSQAGEDRIAAARGVAPWNMVPFQIVDAVVLVMAANTGRDLFQYGLFHLNNGHVWLAGFTVISWFALNINRYFPKLVPVHPLDPTIPIFIRLENSLVKFRDWFKRNTGIDLSRKKKNKKI